MLTSNPSQFSDFVYYVGSAISWLEDVFEGLVDTVFSNWLLAGFLYTIIFLTVFSLVLWFIDDVTDSSSEYTLQKHRKMIREAAAEDRHKQRLSEAEERYQKRKEQNRAEAAERYRNRNSYSNSKPSYDIQKVIDDDNNKPIVYHNRKTQKLTWDSEKRTYAVTDKATGEVVESGTY